MKSTMPRTASSDPVYLQRLRRHYARHRCFPAYSGIGAIVGLNSTSSVSALLRRLAAAGYIALHDRRVVPQPAFFERPLAAGRVPAGLPAAVADVPPDTLAIDGYLVRDPTNTFLVRVQGESMTGAGLLPGDTVVVEARSEARPGAIVVASIDGETTVKRLARRHGRLVLQPENDAYPELAPASFEIVGVVVGSFRRYPRP